MASRPRRLLLLLAAACMVLVACSSAPSASAWAGKVCGALIPWRATITDLNQRAATQLGSASTPDQAKAALVGLLNDARDATERARSAVAAAGVPDANGGAAVASAFEQSLAKTRDAYAAAGTDVTALAADNPSAFYDGVSAIMVRLNSQYQQASAQIDSLDSPEIKQALDAVPECR